MGRDPWLAPLPERILATLAEIGAPATRGQLVSWVPGCVRAARIQAALDELLAAGLVVAELRPAARADGTAWRSRPVPHYAPAEVRDPSRPGTGAGR